METDPPVLHLQEINRISESGSLLVQESRTSAGVIDEPPPAQSPDTQVYDKSDDKSDPAEMTFPGYSQPVDPWEEPLPSWEYSHNEYPVLLSPRGKKSRRKIWILAAIVLLLAGAAIVVSMMLLNPAGAEKSNPNPQATGESQSTALISHTGATEKTEPEPAAQPADPSPSPDLSDQSVGQEKPSPPTGSDETASAQGAVSLQALSSPDEAEANRFADKLKSAGIPAYVVAADINGRGKWFRVRVGRFNSAEDAKKHSAEYRQRAKTAGINLDLIVSGS